MKKKKRVNNNWSWNGMQDRAGVAHQIHEYWRYDDITVIEMCNQYCFSSFPIVSSTSRKIFFGVGTNGFWQERHNVIQDAQQLRTMLSVRKFMHSFFPYNANENCIYVKCISLLFLFAYFMKLLHFCFNRIA